MFPIQNLFMIIASNKGLAGNFGLALNSAVRNFHAPFSRGLNIVAFLRNVRTSITIAKLLQLIQYIYNALLHLRRVPKNLTALGGPEKNLRIVSEASVTEENGPSPKRITRLS